ncbi:hypothetical protein [Bradyrhizobium sp.]|uniref:hyaluronate lyase N-terminal domain-containing protein n=1 Tax=Bradyrhizobium sp. TaxID=376 RepID=UPI0039E48D47
MSTRVQHIRGTTSEVEGVTPLPAELGFDTTKKEPHIGDGSIAGGIRLAKKNIVEVLVAAQITANTNDYSPANLKHAGSLIISTDAARDITGLVPTTVTDATDGREITIYNAGGFNATLKDQNAGSLAANRFDLGGADVVLAPKTSATLRYRVSGGLNRWELKSQTVGAAVAALAVIARTLASSSQGVPLVNGTIVCSVAGGALTVAIKTLAGADPSVSDPVLARVRGGTLANGDYSILPVSTATSLVLSSGSSLGAVSASAFTLRLLGINDAGTYRLGLVNTGRAGASMPVLNPAQQLVTSTAEGGAGAAKSLYIIYTGTAVAGKPYAMLADLDWSSGLTAAGTWDAVPTTISLFDGVPDLSGYGMPAIAKKFTGMFGGQIVESRAGNAVTFAVKTHAGADPSTIDPVYFTVQSGSGGLVVRTITSALSLTVPASQALGTSSAVPFRLWLVAFDTGSTIALGVVNCLSGVSVMPLIESMSYSATAIATAPSAQVIYSGSALTSKYLCIIGHADYDSGMATAGTWNAAPSRIALFSPGMSRPGEVIATLGRFSTGAMATGSTAVPTDNTIPQNNEGDQYMAVTVTPFSPINLARVRSQGIFAVTATVALGVSLYRDSTANALVSVCLSEPLASGVMLATLDYAAQFVSAGGTAFKIRAGGSSGTTTFNGSGGGALYGGVFNSFLEVQEIMA